MKLTSVRLQNFRCFEDTTIHFHEQLTVLVGGNGSGKTAVLDGLSKMLSRIKQEPIVSLNVLQADDMCIYSKNDLFGLFLSCVHNGETHSVEAYYKLNQSELIEAIQNIYSLKSILDKDIKLVQNGRAFAVHYSASRTISEKPEINKNESFKVTIKDITDNKIDFAAAMSWFYAKAVEQAIERDNGDRAFVIPEFDAVKQAILGMLDGYENPRMMYTPSEFVIYKKGHPTIPYKLNHLSDGYRTMLALVMDLARRMAVVNAENYAVSGKSVLESPAIVLIDEVELHLHPSWQQRVLPDLMRTFPNTQFIVTTHSPQVVSSVPADCIRILEDGQVYGVSDVTEGVNAARILKEIFGVDPLPQNIKWARYLKKYEKLVYADGDKWDTACAKALQRKLESHYGKNDPKLDELALHIETRQWERDNEASL